MGNRMVLVSSGHSLVPQLMQQRINGLDTIALGEQVAVRQVSHDSGLGLHLDVVCQPANNAAR
ncbi:hypothetical protein VAWG004_29950 [Aeromonas veronii]|nr:hypothetical protein VAWG004_29950 [Aeromonas veronii]